MQRGQKKEPEIIVKTEKHTALRNMKKKLKHDFILFLKVLSFSLKFPSER